MNLNDQVTFNMQILMRHSVRTFLLLLAIGIGVTSVITLTSLGEGARRFIDKEFSALGNNMLIILPGRKETTGGTPPIFGAVPRDLTLQDAMALKRIPSVREVAPIIAGTTSVALDRRSREVITVGTTHGFFQVRQLNVEYGTILPDRTEALAVCVLGAKLKRELFGNRQAVGEWVRVGDRRARVIGVLEQRGESLGLDLRDIVVIPVATAEQLFNSPGLFRVLLELQTNADPDEVEKQVLATIRERHEGEEDITVISQDSVLSSFNNILSRVTLVIAAIASISLVVAGILIMNISLISVSQRRQEIGLLKAIGASSKQVRQLFLGEALLLMVLGSLLGIGFAYANIYIFRYFWPDFPLTPPVWAVPAASAVAIITGLVFSWLPAMRAARLDPVLALRGQAE